MPTKDIVIPYTPHKGRDGESGQWLVHQSKAPWKVLKKPRRWGGSRAAVNEGGFRIRDWYNDPPDTTLTPRLHFMTASPNYTASTQAWTEMTHFIVNPLTEAGLIKKVKLDEPKTIEIYLPNDGILVWELISTDNPKSLVGRGLDWLWIYDAAYHSNEMWAEFLRPMLTSPGRHGYLFAEGKPTSSLSYFEDLFKRGQDEDDDKVESWHFTAYDSPYITDEEVNDALKDMPELIWRQELMAETIDDINNAFQNVDACATALPEDPVEGRHYVIGCDLGKSVDWTVMVIMDKERRKVVAMERFSKLDWSSQKGKIETCINKWNKALLILDTANVGSAVYDDLKMALPIKPVNLHSTVEKKRIIDALKLALEKETVHFPKSFAGAEASFLYTELKIYQETSTTKKGEQLRTPKLSAPLGKHDDCVIALALALDGAPRSTWEPSGGRRYVESWR